MVRSCVAPVLFCFSQYTQNCIRNQLVRGLLFFPCIRREMIILTKEQERKITILRQQGKGYRAIASELLLSPNTLKSWLKRHSASEKVCLQCGTAIKDSIYKRERKFCSDQCRYMWWNAHPEEKKHQYAHVCTYCKTAFCTNRTHSKYCSIACFAKARKKVDGCEQ